MKKKLFQILMIGATLMLALFNIGGCGGSGGGILGSAFSMFATDDANTNYTGVWVKVYSIDVKNSTGGSVNIFTSATGLTVNMRALNDGAAKFLLLAPGQLPNGTYNKVNFELDKSVTLVATGSGVSSTANFPDALNATTTGHSNLSVDLAPALTIPGATKVIVDFDLKNWTVAGGIITPVLKIHDGTGFTDPTRHEQYDFEGAVTGLTGTAPTQSFTITLHQGGTVIVNTDATTTINGENGLTTLANGQKVEVFGAFDPTTSTIAAKIIHVDGSSTNNDGVAKAVGTASAGDPVAQTFTLAPKCTRGFAPQGATITVSTSSTTVYHGAHGATLTETQFYTALAGAGANATAEARGTFDAASNTLTATSVSIESESDMGDAEAQGTASAGDSVAGTFQLTATQTHGFTAPGGPISVTLASDVQIRGSHDTHLTNSDFFTAIAAGSVKVQIQGSFSNSVFTATEIQVGN